MAQITNGMRTILADPRIYYLFTLLMGAYRFQKEFVTTAIRPFQGIKILDIGCGPADILSHLPDAEYWGFDINQKYIDHAQKKFGKRAHFQCKQLQLSDLADLPSFDIVLAIGLLHHLDDLSATATMQLASKALKKGGRLLTIDPCLDPEQNEIARFLIRYDRGQNVRDKAGYHAIAIKTFQSPKVEVRHKLWVPYTHCFMECQK